MYKMVLVSMLTGSQTNKFKKKVILVFLSYLQQVHNPWRDQDPDLRYLFSRQKVNITKLTADMYFVKKYLVIHEILVVQMPRMTY